MTIPTDAFYLQQPEPQKGCLLAMRALLLQLDPAITETTKYGMPCFCYKKKIMCYLWLDKHTQDPYFLLADGNRLSHPALEAGGRSRMKILRVAPTEDLPVATIHDVFNEALSLYRDSTR